ncbi:conjugal transfer protein TraF [Helicobacter sp. 13S00477-4]|uniref:conjugal transfer protein TraF n=1 Tax=Helicobacter sp. 13S00477-4 TaxID=1905759 RepID=UPI000BA57A78|nr:conjugal transfer protein TraF [Helicobacter sp. 13S00477-4]PAF52625.1 hypothetical protein BKH44_00085 [Helicobacter sp. 13S00477-4]
MYCRIFKIILASSLLGSGLKALEFGGMGNISSSMGGAGVALRNSQWALYYNPALLGIDKKSRIAYSFGVQIKEKNFLSLAGIDYENLKNMPDKIGGIIEDSPKSGVLGGAITSVQTINLGGTLGNVLKNIDFKNTSGAEVSGLKTTQNVQDFFASILTNSGASTTQVEAVTNATDIKSATEAFKNAVINPSNGKPTHISQNITDNVKGNFSSAIDKTTGESGDNEALRLIKNIISNLDSNNISGVANLVSKAEEGGKFTINDLLTTLGGVTLTNSNDPQINRFIQDIDTLQNALRKNNFNLVSQNGLVFQIGGNGADSRGAIAFGIFANAFTSANASFDPTHNQIIIDTDSNYVRVDIHKDSINLSSSNSSDFNAYSLLSPDARHQIHGTGITVSEIPIGYGQAFSTPIGNISVGFAAKYIFGMGYGINKIGSFDSLSNSFGDIDFKGIPQTQTFGIDFGLLYNYKGLSLGLVGKDLNEPVIKLNNNQKIILNSQYRAGISYEWKFLSIAMDADLVANHTLSYLSPKNQMIGGGIMLDFKYIDFRFGSMYDIKSQEGEGIILTGGLNILGFFDLAVQSNLKTTNLNGYKLPSYLSLRLGGGFSW